LSQLSRKGDTTYDTLDTKENGNEEGQGEGGAGTSGKKKRKKKKKSKKKAKAKKEEPEEDIYAERTLEEMERLTKMINKRVKET